MENTTKKIYILLNVFPFEDGLQVTQDAHVYTDLTEAVIAFNTEAITWESFGFSSIKAWSHEDTPNESYYMESEGILLQTMFQKEGRSGFLILRENNINLVINN